MKRVFAAGMLALAMVTTTAAANAADIARRQVMPAKAPAYVEPPFNWTGFYLGINGGYGWGRSTWDDGVVADRFNVRGGVVGGTVGYNWQMGPTVLGLEGDLDWSNMKGSTVLAPCVSTSCETRNNWLGTARARIGYAFGRFMPYITGGAAFGDVKMTPAGLGSETDNRVGWTAGAGVEAALGGPWSAKLEYLYADLGNANCTAATCGASTNVKFNTNLVRAGINFHF
jgi:outer membrane immunogenic protein